MQIEKDTPEALKKLAQAMVQEPDRDVNLIDEDLTRGFKQGALPARFERLAGDGKTLLIAGEDFRLYEQALLSLTAEKKMEHLTARDIDAELWEFVPVLAALLPQLGAAGSSYVEIAEQITACTGGIDAGMFLGTDARDPTRCLRFFTLAVKTLDHSFQAALDLVWKLLTEPDLRDSQRILDVLRQRRVRLRSGIVRNGHRFAAAEAAQTLSPSAALHRLSEAVQTEKRAEGTVLEPAHDQLTEVRRFGVAVVKTADVCSPPGDTAQADVEAGTDL